MNHKFKSYSTLPVDITVTPYHTETRLGPKSHSEIAQVSVVGRFRYGKGLQQYINGFEMPTSQWLGGLGMHGKELIASIELKPNLQI